MAQEIPADKDDVQGEERLVHEIQTVIEHNETVKTMRPPEGTLNHPTGVLFAPPFAAVGGLDPAFSPRDARTEALSTTARAKSSWERCRNLARSISWGGRSGSTGSISSQRTLSVDLVLGDHRLVGHLKCQATLASTRTHSALHSREVA